MALWNILIEICQHEKSDFLPQQISTLVLKLIEIQKFTYSNSRTQYAEDYIKYDSDRDDPTSFYPNHPYITYLKLSTVNRTTDIDFCKKIFESHVDFTDGIFFFKTG